MRSAQLRQLQAHMQRIRPAMHTWRPRGPRNEVIISLWYAIDELASATGRDPATIAHVLQQKAHRTAGHLIRSTRAEPAGSGD